MTDLRLINFQRRIRLRRQRRSVKAPLLSLIHISLVQSGQTFWRYWDEGENPEPSASLRKRQRFPFRFSRRNRHNLVQSTACLLYTSTVFFLITVLLLWKTRKKSLLLELVYWLVVSLYAWSAWFTEFQDLSRNSLLYLAVLRWLTLTFFRDPINFCGFLLLAGVGLKSLFTSLRAVSGRCV